MARRKPGTCPRKSAWTDLETLTNVALPGGAAFAVSHDAAESNSTRWPALSGQWLSEPPLSTDHPAVAASSRIPRIRGGCALAHEWLNRMLECDPLFDGGLSRRLERLPLSVLLSRGTGAEP